MCERVYVPVRVCVCMGAVCCVLSSRVGVEGARVIIPSSGEDH